jgi:hypothetical protein
VPDKVRGEGWGISLPTAVMTVQSPPRVITSSRLVFPINQKALTFMDEPR